MSKVDSNSFVVQVQFSLSSRRDKVWQAVLSISSQWQEQSRGIDCQLMAQRRSQRERIPQPIPDRCIFDLCFCLLRLALDSYCRHCAWQVWLNNCLPPEAALGERRRTLGVSIHICKEQPQQFSNNLNRLSTSKICSPQPARIAKAVGVHRFISYSIVSSRQLM